MSLVDVYIVSACYELIYDDVKTYYLHYKFVQIHFLCVFNIIVLKH